VNKSIQDLFNDSVRLVESNKFDEAIPNLDTIIRLHSLVVSALIQRGRCHWEMHRWDKSIKDFELALQMDPDSPDAKWTIGLMTLQLGNFERGWPMYEARWESDAFKSPKLKTKLPRWEPDKGYQSVLVWCEQGIGDQILYGSLLNALSIRADKVTVMLDIRLIGLFQRALPHINFIRHDARVKNSEYDSQIPIGSLGSAFINSYDDIPKHRSVGFLVPDPKQVDVLARQIGKQEGEFVLGLSWASTAPRVGEHKSIQLKELAPLFDIPNLKVVNLQYGKEKEQIADFEKDTGKKIIQTTVNTFFDLEGVAAMMRCCDAVVSVSNANVHLAAAMGTPVLMLDANKLWYWNGKDGNRSLWYPSLQMFNRENMVAPWDKPVQQMIKALQEIKNG
jgi:hypothetical protein